MLRQAFWGTGFGILVAVLAIATWRYGPYALRSDLDAARTEIAALKSRLDALEKK